MAAVPIKILHFLVTAMMLVNKYLLSAVSPLHTWLNISSRYRISIQPTLKVRPSLAFGKLNPQSFQLAVSHFGSALNIQQFAYSLCFALFISTCTGSAA